MYSAAFKSVIFYFLFSNIISILPKLREKSTYVLKGTFYNFVSAFSLKYRNKEYVVNITHKLTRSRSSLLLKVVEHRAYRIDCVLTELGC